MALRIKLKNSVVQDRVPTTSDLPEVGELAVNANINSIGGFMRASDNSVVKIFGPGSLSTPTATTSVSGISELATNSETTTGTATNRVVTPAGLNAVTVAERTTSNTNYVAKSGSTLTGVLTMPNGSNSSPAINFGDSDSGIFGGTNTVSLAAGGTTRLTADTGVSVVGTLAVNGAITSTSDLTVAEKVIHAGDTDTFLSFPAANTVSIEAGGNEALRVDNSQRLLVGTSSSRGIGGTATRLFQVEGGNKNGISITRNTSDNNPVFLSLGKSRSTSSGGTTIVQENDDLGEIQFCGADGTDLISRAAFIRAEVDGTPGSDDMPGRLVFGTTADGAASPTTRLTIDSAGLVKLPDNGKFVAGAGNDLQIFHDGNSNIVNTTGELNIRNESRIKLRTDQFVLNNHANDESIIFAQANGSVELYFDNDRKFRTISSGCQVESTTGDTFLVVRSEEDNAGSDAFIRLQVENTSATSGVLFGDSADGDIGQILYEHADNTMRFRTNTAEQWRITSDGHLENNNDTGRIKLGTSDDLQIYHNGNNSLIKDTGTGNLLLSTNQMQVINAAESEIIARFDENSGVELYHNSSKKFETTSTGATVTGQIVADGLNVSGSAFFHGNVDLHDDDRLRLGSGDDLQIYHDGSNSYIKQVSSGTGNLLIFADGHEIQLIPKSGEPGIKVINDGAVELYHNGSKKFETNGSGCHVTGSLTADTVAVQDNEKFLAGNNDDLQIYHNGNNSFIDNSTGNLNIRGSTFQFKKLADSEDMLKLVPNGAVELYFDNSKKLETTTNGVHITGTTFLDDSSRDDNFKAKFGTGDDLQIFHNGSNSFIENEGTGSLFIRGGSSPIDIRAVDGEKSIEINAHSSVDLYHDGSKKFETTSAGVRVTGNTNMTNTVASNVVSIHHNHNSQRSCLDLTNAFANGGNSAVMIEFRDSGGNSRGTIFTSTSATTYNTSSDYRLKENQVEISDGITRLKTLKPYRFNFKVDPDTTVDGFFAHEVQLVVPQAITGTKDEVDSDNNPVYQGIDQSKLVPLLTAALQEAIAKIEVLETKVAALEAA